jgi:hypothetical protein
LLLHLSVHGRDSKVIFVHGLFEFVYSLFVVAVDQSLVDI